MQRVFCFFIFAAPKTACWMGPNRRQPWPQWRWCCPQKKKNAWISRQPFPAKYLNSSAIPWLVFLAPQPIRFDHERINRKKKKKEKKKPYPSFTENSNRDKCSAARRQVTTVDGGGGGNGGWGGKASFLFFSWRPCGFDSGACCFLTAFQSKGRWLTT